MKLKLALATATAMTLLMGVAHAGSSNTLFISQDGDRNSADVKQNLGNDSTIGTSVDHALQSGSDNRLTFAATSWGTNDNNDIVNFEQNGSWNLFHAQGAGGSSNNVLSNLLQQGAGNSVRVHWTAASNGSVDDVSIVGDRNAVSIYQGHSLSASSGNVVGTVSITGSRNGYATGNQWAHGDDTAAVHIRQIGSGNEVASSTVTGSDNHAPNIWATGAFNKVHEIFQTGNNNGQGASVASTLGSDGNWIRVNQQGDWNDFSVQQGVSTASTDNYATVTQTGDFNAATVTQYGSSNQIIVDQNGDDNTATANFTGDGNGVGTLTGFAGALDTAQVDLTQGTIFQDSGLSATGNTVTYNVTGSNNLFAFAQLGAGNAITGTVGSSGASNANQVAVIQTGSTNNSTFTQNGGSNNLAVSQ